MVENIEFELDDHVLSYRPSGFVRGYQAFAGFSFSVIFLFVAGMIWRNKPFKDLFGSGFDTLLAFSFVGLAIVFVIAVPTYLRKSSRPYIIDATNREIRLGRKVLLNLQPTKRIEVVTKTETTGEGSTRTTWSVTVCGDPHRHQLPLLLFENKRDADRVANTVSQFLRVPIEG